MVCCSVCYWRRATTLTVPCMHRFCRECIRRCLCIDQRCPLCRTPSCGLRSKRISVQLWKMTRRKVCKHYPSRSWKEVEGGVVLMSPTPEAKRCGLSKGDVVTSVNGVPAVAGKVVNAICCNCIMKDIPISFERKPRWTIRNHFVRRIKSHVDLAGNVPDSNPFFPSNSSSSSDSNAREGRHEGGGRE